MQKNNYKKLVFEFVALFLSIYKVDDIKFLEFKNNQLFGKIYWNDSEEDEDDVYFKWNADLEPYQIINLIDMLNYILNNELYYSDIINISEEKLIEVFKNKGWTEKTVKDTLENLFNIDIDRYENNEKVGSFFVHS